MGQFNTTDILAMEQRYRAAFINSLGGFKSGVLVGTVSKEGNTNLAIFNSLFHLGANPALCGLIIRPDSVARHTYENILETGSYTINHINEGIYKQAHQTSARYDREVSEFDATGLTLQYEQGVMAPFVKKSHVQFALEFAEKHELQINGTILVIGKIVKVILPDECIGADGFIDIERAGTITVSGLDSYHTTQRLSRLSYAKPGIAITEVS
ncbi:flavin oxidoreductase [Flavipsychrobacter stenotrophus]|uniref:Flavin oxidoreductase n=1 Tax=Flavipsychrobacter stenotrophus TaxID=2077091 RepID=A0A2S7SUJ5_9BACT|nr:flavin reductase [Flavipsychrobacter stenotrophus]PQJ10206.1 flavin oxidoreductase [Flavipsychrobacter stenotrophus]